MYAFKLPDLGEGIHEGEILKWHVTVGQQVVEDAPLVDVETDKAAVTIPSPATGTIVSLSGKVGEVVYVGQELVVIDDGRSATVTVTAATAAPAPATATAPATAAVAAPAAAPATAAAAATAPAPASVDVGARRVVPAAPATRRLARELRVDLRLVPPSGAAGRVTSEDVQRFAASAAAPTEALIEAPAVEPRGPLVGSPGALERRTISGFAAMVPAPPLPPHPAPAGQIPFLDLEPLPDFSQWGPVEKEPLRSIRRRVARKMVTSMTLVPHVAHMDEADVTLLEEFRRRERDRRNGQPGGHLTLLGFVIKAVTAGLRATPAFNASLDPFSEEIVYKRYYNIGIAVDTGKGLVVPVIRETDRKSIVQISRDIEELSGRARAGTLEAGEMRGGTFTITNIGPLGGTALIPAINYPEAAILGMGRVQEKPVVRDGQIVVRKILPLTLAFDHRLADGADAARFVTEMVRQLSDPNLLLLET